MKSKIDKTQILSRIKIANALKNDAALARYLSISTSLLSNWQKRNSIDFDLVFTKCKHIDANWLLTGEGPMLKTDSVMVSPGECLECKNKAARIDMLEAILEGKDELIQSQKDLIAELKKNTQARPAPVAKRVAM